ncbi:TCEANC2 [Bugula neritina]|uniref:TCEANC2 n=1 Tax=Bugula neritina TaxID=10212 RepID=A0A7J7KN38_BUGNE|nr:TCEANC2 [Bugula neritina]
MDKYVIRKPRDIPERKKSQEKVKELKQTTIFSLKRVVVVEDIKRIKSLLEITDQDSEVIFDQLKLLEQKIPSKEVLLETKLGLTLKKLKKHENVEVAAKASSIYAGWKKHFKDKLDKPCIEVRYDNATNKCRDTSRRLICDCLSPHKESALLADSIERCIFERTKNTAYSYRRHIRGIVFTLRYKEHIKQELLNKQLTVIELCQMKKPTG